MRLTIIALIAAALALGRSYLVVDVEVQGAAGRPLPSRRTAAAGCSRRHQRQHREGEQRQLLGRRTAAGGRVFGHIADGVDVHASAEKVTAFTHHEHHGGERVDAQRPGGLQIAYVDQDRSVTCAPPECQPYRRRTRRAPRGAEGPAREECPRLYRPKRGQTNCNESPGQGHQDNRWIHPPYVVNGDGAAVPEIKTTMASPFPPPRPLMLNTMSA